MSMREGTKKNDIIKEHTLVKHGYNRLSHPKAG